MVNPVVSQLVVLLRVDPLVSQLISLPAYLVPPVCHVLQQWWVALIKFQQFISLHHAQLLIAAQSYSLQLFQSLRPVSHLPAALYCQCHGFLHWHEVLLGDILGTHFSATTAAVCIATAPVDYYTSEVSNTNWVNNCQQQTTDERSHGNVSRFNQSVCV